MRWILFKTITFLALFVFMQGALLPWAISNDTMPLWADIGVVTIILLLWLAVIDRLAFHLLRILRKNDNITE